MYGGGSYGGGGYGGGGYGGGGGDFGGRRGGGRGGGRGGRRNDRPDYIDDPEAEQFRKLFIGGLSYETTKETLQQHFEQWGELTDCVVMINPETKKSRGFGFVTFKEAHMVDDAQAARPHNIDGRDVESKRPMPREESRKEDSKRSTEKMFVGGCSPDTDEDSVRDLFSQYGNIKNINVVKDKETDRCKGFCFVEFDDADCVDKCVLKKKFELCGKTVDVNKAQDKDGGGRGGGRGGRGGGRGGGGGYGSGGGYGGGGGYSSGGYGGGGYGQQSSYGSSSYGNGYSADSYSGGYDQGGSFGSGYRNDYGGGSMKGGSYSRQQPYSTGGGGRY